MRATDLHSKPTVHTGVAGEGGKGRATDFAVNVSASVFGPGKITPGKFVPGKHVAVQSYAFNGVGAHTSTPIGKNTYIEPNCHLLKKMATDYWT